MIKQTQVRNLLINMMEEAGEVTQAAGKWVRFGAESHHPEDPQKLPNKVLLAREIGNLLAIATLLGGDNMLCEEEIRIGFKTKIENLKKYGYIDKDENVNGDSLS